MNGLSVFYKDEPVTGNIYDQVIIRKVAADPTYPFHIDADRFYPLRNRHTQFTECPYPDDTVGIQPMAGLEYFYVFFKGFIIDLTGGGII